MTPFSPYIIIHTHPLFTLPLYGYKAFKQVTFRPECIMQGVINNLSDVIFIMLTKATLRLPQQKLLYYQVSFDN